MQSWPDITRVEKKLKLQRRPFRHSTSERRRTELKNYRQHDACRPNAGGGSSAGGNLVFLQQARHACIYIFIGLLVALMAVGMGV